MSSDNPRKRGAIPWIPLAATAVIATIGVIAWAFNPATNDDSDYNGKAYGDHSPTDSNLDYEGASQSGPEKSRGIRLGPNSVDNNDSSRGSRGSHNQSWTDRVSGALQHATSPRSIVGPAIAATGSVISSTLSVFRDGDSIAYADHKTWSEEIGDRGKRANNPPTPSLRPQLRKTVAIVVAANNNNVSHSSRTSGFEKQSPSAKSILSDIPDNLNFDQVRLFVLIYAPSLQKPRRRESSPSLDSSYYNVEEEAVEHSPSSYQYIRHRALQLVEKDVMVLPFSTPTGYLHILRHLQPNVLYLQESLSGADGTLVGQMQAWMKHDICVVVDTQAGNANVHKKSLRDQNWWQRKERTGKGRGVVVVGVEGVREDWLRRVL